MNGNGSKDYWKINFQVYRQKNGDVPYYQMYQLEVHPDEYVLDGIERIWAYHDRSLTFRHACHHSVCGACGMRLNGDEKLTCITPIHTVVKPGGILRVDPLRNFPIISDLVVDMGDFYRDLEAAGQETVQPVSEAASIRPVKVFQKEDAFNYLRLSDCIECGLCVSACPIAGSDPDYLGPAVLAAVQQRRIDREPELASLVDREAGAWRCHSAFECSEVCPSKVEPGWRIMDLRWQLIRRRVRGLFSPQPSVREVRR